MRKNLLANYFGQVTNAALGFIFLPFYFKYLGAESYGVIGLYASIQAWMLLLDLGMSSSLNREMARYKASVHSKKSIADLLRTIEVILLLISGIVFLGIAFSSKMLATKWLTPGSISIGSVEKSINLIAIVIALRFFESLYRSGLMGLEKQVISNSVGVVLSIFRYGGALVVLSIISPTIEVFFVWQVIVSLASFFCHTFLLYYEVSLKIFDGKFDLASLKDVYIFAGGSFFANLFAVALLQIDKILLSNLLTLQGFGYFMLATAISNAVFLAAIPISQAYSPIITRLVEGGDEKNLITTFHKACKLLTLMVAPLSLVIIFFTNEVVYIWTGDRSLSLQISLLVKILVGGSLINALMYGPFMLQISHGWTRLSVLSNMTAVVFYAPLIYLIVPRYGAIGAAVLWLLLNVVNFLLIPHLMHSKILSKEKSRWYLDNTIIPIIWISTILSIMAYFFPENPSRAASLTYLILICIAVFSVAFYSLEFNIKAIFKK